MEFLGRLQGIAVALELAAILAGPLQPAHKA